MRINDAIAKQIIEGLHQLHAATPRVRRRRIRPGVTNWAIYEIPYLLNRRRPKDCKAVFLCRFTVPPERKGIAYTDHVEVVINLNNASFTVAVTRKPAPRRALNGALFTSHSLTCGETGVVRWV